jgi:hypothetical protein
VRIRATYTFEYEVDMKFYEGASTPQEALAIDLANAEDDPLGLLQIPEDLTIKLELVEP